jgi:hypothetical protein
MPEAQIYEDPYTFARVDPEYFNWPLALVGLGPQVAAKQYRARRRRK